MINLNIFSRSIIEALVELENEYKSEVSSINTKKN